MNELLLLTVILLPAVIWDYRKGIIPNKLIIVGIIMRMVSFIAYSEVREFYQYIPGMLFPLILLYPLYKIGGIGAGDIKLLSLIGIYLSFHRTIFCIFLTFVFSAILSLIKMIRYRNFWERLSYLFSYLGEILTSGKIHYYYLNINEQEIKKQAKIGLAAPIFLAAMITGGFL